MTTQTDRELLGLVAGGLDTLESMIHAAIKEAVEREREACAKVCDTLRDNADFPEGWSPVSEACAAAIRARSKEQT